MGMFEVLFGEQPASFDFKWFRATCPVDFTWIWSTWV